MSIKKSFIRSSFEIFILDLMVDPIAKEYCINRTDKINFRYEK